MRFHHLMLTYKSTFPYRETPFQPLALRQMPGPGAPLGNQNAARSKRWTAAIERALERKGVDAQLELDKLAEEFVAAVRLAALKGDISGFRELGDRMEGKATQIVAGDPGGAPIVHRIEQVIVEPPGDRDSTQT